MALNSSELPLGSWKNIVHCSPGWPATQLPCISKPFSSGHPACNAGAKLRHHMVLGCSAPAKSTSSEQAVTFKTQVWLQDEGYAGRFHVLRQLMELLYRQSHPKVRHRHGVPVDCVHRAG